MSASSAIAAAGSIAMLFVASAAAAQTAPLPPHWTLREQDPPSEHARPRGEPAGTLRGIYGHGVTHPFDAGSVDLDVAGAPPVCRGDRAAQAAYLARIGGHRTEFWFYGTRRQGVLFRREALIPSAQPCERGPEYAYDIDRAFVADGYVHTMEMTGDGGAEMFSSRAIGSSDDEYAGGFEPLHNIMARDAAPREGEASNERIAGVPARCWTSGGGYVWSRVCVSRSGPTRGMILASGAGDDSQTLFEMEFRELLPDAALDARLFDLERDWDAPD
jgi:hypothetical protein